MVNILGLDPIELRWIRVCWARPQQPAEKHARLRVFTLRLLIHPFFDAPTNSYSYVLVEPGSGVCAVFDAVQCV